jgi:hypothetical protein
MATSCSDFRISGVCCAKSPCFPLNSPILCRVDASSVEKLICFKYLGLSVCTWSPQLIEVILARLVAIERCYYLVYGNVSTFNGGARRDRQSGAAGLAGGDHLHLEIFVHGQSVDPLQWLDGKWIQEKIMSKIGR